MKLTHPSACLTHGLMRAARSLARGFEAEAVAVGVTAPQFTVLAKLAGFGEMTVSQIAQAVAADRTTMTRNLAVMAQKGWIVETEGADRRERVWTLTDAGRTALSKVMPIWQAWQARLVGQIGDDTATNLLATLRSLTDP